METNISSIKIRLKEHTLEQIASIPESRPYKSILTNTPKANLLLPLVFVKFTKAFFFVTFLALFVDRSIAQGVWDYGYPPPVSRLDGSPSNINNKNGNPDTHNEQETISKLQSKSAAAPDRASPNVPKRAVKLTKKAKQDLLNGIAQDIFFHPMELNFYEARWPEFLSEWASESQSRYDNAFQTRIGLSKFTFFAEDVLNWEGFDCSLDLRGCQKMPTTEMVRKHFPNDRFKARQVIYALDSFRKLHTEAATYTDALNYATDTVSGYCREFGRVFFHGETKGYKKMCTAQIIQIVMGVITAIIAVVSIGQALFAIAPLIAGGLSSIVASSAVVATEIGGELAVDGVIELGVDASVDAAVEAAAQVASEAAVVEGSSQGLIQGIDIPLWARDVFLETNSFVWKNFEYVAPFADAEVVTVTGDEVAGSSVGAVGESAVSDAASTILDTMSGAESVFSEVSMTSEQFEGFIQGTGYAQAEILEQETIRAVSLLTRAGLNPYQMPRWLNSISRGLIDKALYWATGQVRVLTKPLFLKNVLIFWASQLLKSQTLAQAAAAGYPVAVVEKTSYDNDNDDDNDNEQLYRTLQNVTLNALLDIVIATAGREVEVADIPKFVAEEKEKLFAKRRALQLSMDVAMSSFTKSKGDNSTSPKEWGSFGVMEWFPVDSLLEGEDSVYDQASVESRLFFKQYPKALQFVGKNDTWAYDIDQISKSDPSKDPSFLRMDGNATVADFDPNVVRVSKLFTMYELEAPKRTIPNVDSPWSLGPRIVWRMQDQNGIGMLASDAMKFWEDNSDEIHRRVHLLRQADHRSKYVPLKKPFAQVQIEDGALEPGICIGVNTALDTLPWTSILGTVEFTGYGSTNNDWGDHAPELRWKAKPNEAAYSALEKRDAQMYIERLARHDIRGKINTLQSIGLIGSNRPRGKREDDGVPIQHEATADGSIFIAQVNDHLFKNDIHHEACGLDHYTGDSAQNEVNCHTFLARINDQISQELYQSVQFNELDLQIFTTAVSNRFSNYASFVEADSLAVDKSGLKEKLKDNLKNNLVSKAYADENCFLQCFPSPTSVLENREPFRVPSHEDQLSMNYHRTRCAAGCFDPIGMQFELLYGFGSDQSAEMPPWNLNEEEINRASWGAYVNGNAEGYLPGRIDLNPYTHSVKDQSPILPVCNTQFGGPQSSGLLCNCGNKYGDETENVVATANWKSATKNNEYDAINVCLNRLGPLAMHSPAAFLVNMCRVFFRQFVPPGTGSHQETHDKGDYGRNLIACKKYLDFYEQHKTYDDTFLNDRLCTMWAYEGKNFHADGLHPDFSFVNSMLAHGGCDSYK